MLNIIHNERDDKLAQKTVAIVKLLITFYLSNENVWISCPLISLNW